MCVCAVQFVVNKEQPQRNETKKSWKKMLAYNKRNFYNLKPENKVVTGAISQSKDLETYSVVLRPADSRPCV